jgi:hypothetical protein
MNIQSLYGVEPPVLEEGSGKIFWLFWVYFFIEV